jgi:hypothetical protein
MGSHAVLGPRERIFVVPMHDTLAVQQQQAPPTVPQQAPEATYSGRQSIRDFGRNARQNAYKH